MVQYVKKKKSSEELTKFQNSLKAKWSTSTLYKNHQYWNQYHSILTIDSINPRKHNIMNDNLSNHFIYNLNIKK